MVTAVAFLVSEKDKLTERLGLFDADSEYVYLIGAEMHPSAFYVYSSSNKHNRGCIF